MKTIIITGTLSGLGQSLFNQIISNPVRLICIARRFLPYQELLAPNNGALIQLLKQDLTHVDEQSSEVEKYIIDEYIGL